MPGLSYDGKALADAYTEPARRVPIRGRYDVIVAGGGLGGVSAAMAAARAGARVLLIERNGYPGGVAIAGMCCSVFNAFYTRGHELIVRGNALEITDAFAATGPGPAWRRHKGHIIYDFECAKLALGEKLEEAGAGYLFDTMVAGVIKKGKSVKGVLIESKSGREAVLAPVVVDATGDADVARLAGVPLHCKPRGAFNKVSYCFRIGNVDVDRFVQYFVEHPDQYPGAMDVDWDFDAAARQYAETGTFLFPHGGGIQMEIIRRGIERGEFPARVGVHTDIDACQMHALREPGVVHIITGFCDVGFAAPGEPDVADITRAMVDGRRMAHAVTEFFHRHVPGFERACVTATADDLGIRIGRWLDAEFVFEPGMKADGARFTDAIGRGVCEKVVVRHPGARAFGVQIHTDDTYDISYRCLLPRRVEGIVMGAGRSVSARNPSLLRTMVMTMVVGQGAGVAAAVAAGAGVRLREV
ncbi:MAG: FAD-dependent oxidoreductase, partial [bacterium]|nr:FAD-dependent oxidoreductase [bacterium]